MDPNESLKHWSAAAKAHPEVVGDATPPGEAETASTTQGASRPNSHHQLFPSKYRIEGLIAQTRISRTWKAFDTERNMQVVIKEPLARLFVDREAEERFRQEVQLTAGLTHANIVPILATHLAEPPWFYTMPYIEGDHLDRYCKNQDLSLKERLKLFLKVCDAVSHAHQHGVIHRDLKPNNILVPEEGEPLLFDFGLGGAIGPDAEAEGLGIGGVMGSPGYMAPEQAAGLPGDTRTDVYALGVILFQLLAGHLPITPASDLDETLRRVREDKPQKPAMLNPKVSWEVDAVIIKALEKEPAARYQSVTDLAGDLGGWLKGKPVSAVPNTAWYIFGKWLRSHKLLVAVGTCLVAAMIGLAVFAVGKSIESEKARVAGHVKNVLMGCWQADRDDPLNASALLWSEYRKQQPPDLRTEYALWEFYRRYPCVYAVNAGPLLDVECSPTGKWLVTTTLDGALKVFDSATGLGVQRIDKDAACAWCLKFAPDGKRIYTGGMDGKIRVWGFAEQTGRLDDTPLVTLDATGTRVNCIAVSPDGQWLAAGMGEVDSGVDKKRCDITDAKVCLWRVAHSEYEFLRRIDHPCKVHGLAFSADNTLLASGTTAHGGHGSVRVWDTRSGELLHERAFGQHCRALRFSKDGSCLFIGGTHLLRWAFNTEAVEPLESDSRWGVRSIDLLELGANRSVIAVAAGDGRVRLYDAESRDRLRIQGYHDAEQTHVDVCFSPNGETFASVSRDGLKVWELPPAKSILFKRRLQEVPYITLSEDGSRIAAVSYHQDKTWAIDVWHRNPTSNLNRTPGKQRWEAQAIDPLPQPFGTPALSGDGCGLAFSDGVGEFVATRCLYVLDNDRPIMPKIMFPSDWGRVNWLLWHGSDANTLLLACSDGPMRAWRRQHGTTGRKSQFEPCFDGFAGQCTYVATSRDGKWLAACSEWDRSTGQGRVVLWRSTGLDLHSHAFENAYTLRSEFGTGGCTWRVALVKAENGDLLLATAGNRKDVRLWDGGSGELVARLAGHRDSIFGCFALNDRMLVTASRDGTVRVWDVWQREEVCVLYSRQGVTPSISVCNGRIAIADNNTVTIADTRRIQSYLDGNRGFEHQRPADHR